jgi:FtsH ternary system domain X5
MSRAYRIAVKESLSRHVQVDDGVSSSLELLPILQKERMRELLAAELAGKGFTREGTTATRRQDGGVTVRVDLESGGVDIVAEGHTELELSTERTAVAAEPGDAARTQALQAVARTALEREAKAEEEALRKQVTQQLEGTLRDLRAELDGVVNRVTASALKARAAELGEVEAIHEEPNGNLTIKVRV